MIHLNKLQCSQSFNLNPWQRMVAQNFDENYFLSFFLFQVIKVIIIVCDTVKACLKSLKLLLTCLNLFVTVWGLIQLDWTWFNLLRLVLTCLDLFHLVWTCFNLFNKNHFWTYLYNCKTSIILKFQIQSVLTS